MIREFCKILPPGLLLGVFAVIYLAMSFSAIWLISVHDSYPEEFTKNTYWIMFLFSLSFGAIRQFRFHPVWNKEYLDWLKLSPWEPGKPLLKGSVLLTGYDLAFLLIISVLGAAFSFSNIIYILLGYSAGYIILSIVCMLFAKSYLSFFVATFIAPFSIYPFQNPYIALIPGGLIYIIWVYDTKKWLKNFPWNTPWWRMDMIEQIKKEQTAPGKVGYPYNLNLTERMYPRVNRLFWLALSALIVWWIHVLAWTIQLRTVKFIFFIALYAAGLRAMAYMTMFHAPISILGRFSTGRIIIPGYDKLFIAPASILLIGILCPKLLLILGISNNFVYDLILFTVLLMTFTLPPGIRQFSYTSPYHLRKFKPPKRTTSEANADMKLSINRLAAG